jgi:hypothetical protein
VGWPSSHEKFHGLKCITNLEQWFFVVAKDSASERLLTAFCDEYQ